MIGFYGGYCLGMFVGLAIGAVVCARLIKTHRGELQDARHSFLLVADQLSRGDQSYKNRTLASIAAERAEQLNQA